MCCSLLIYFLQFIIIFCFRCCFYAIYASSYNSNTFTNLWIVSIIPNLFIYLVEKSEQQQASKYRRNDILLRHELWYEIWRELYSTKCGMKLWCFLFYWFSMWRISFKVFYLIYWLKSKYQNFSSIQLSKTGSSSVEYLNANIVWVFLIDFLLKIEH